MALFSCRSRQGQDIRRFKIQGLEFSVQPFTARQAGLSAPTTGAWISFKCLGPETCEIGMIGCVVFVGPQSASKSKQQPLQ